MWRRFLWLALLAVATSFRPVAPRLPYTALRICSTARKDSSDTEKRKNVDLYKVLEEETLTGAREKKKRLFKPEVLAPAGGWPQVRAALTSGADAVYFGLQEGFNARARASNFGIEEVPLLMNYLHERGAKGYCVVNVLVFDEELAKLEDLIKRLALAGVDALIMQDLGAAAFARRVAPNLPVHGSTQMTITDASGATFAESLGIDRVVVGRELSIDEIESVSSNSGAEVEAFVHGALCVSYSGQCFSSEAWGGRSANRGQCAQACRLPYGLIVNGTLKDLHDVSYLLSPQDLMAVDHVPRLIEAGVRSFKIEGRLKGEEYVAVTTKAYRAAVDEAWAEIERRGLQEGSTPEGMRQVQEQFAGPDEATRKELKQVFSRGQDEEHDGLSAGFLLGVRHQELVRGRSPRHRGLLVGRVQGVSTKGIDVLLSGPVKRGDGVAFDSGSPEEKEEGGAIYDIFDSANRPAGKGEERGSGRVRLTFGSGCVDHSRIKIGSIVWKTKDPALEAKLASGLSSAGPGALNLLPVRAKVSGALGAPLSVELLVKEGAGGVAREGQGEAPLPPSGRGLTASPLVAAETRPTTAADIVKALGSLGDSTFRLEAADVDIQLDDGGAGVFVAAGEIKAARRAAVQELTGAVRRHSRGVGAEISNPPLLPTAHEEARAAAAAAAASANAGAGSGAGAGAAGAGSDVQMTVLCRSPQQADAACQVPWLKEVALDFLEVHGLREAVARVKQAGKRCIVATPRVIKPNEERLHTFYLRLRPDALLVRSAGFMQQLIDIGGPGAAVPGTNGSVLVPELRGDFSLNAANVLSSAILLEKGSLSRLTPTHDLNSDQISNLGRELGDCSSLEVVVYQHLPIFHTEHCVFCKFLSSGNSYKDCGHPCETNTVHLRGLDGQDNLVLADQGCRNTVFNAAAQSGAAFMPQFVSAGIRNFRLEFVDEPAETVGQLLHLYRNVALQAQAGASAGSEAALAELNACLQSVPNSIGGAAGYTAGSLEPTVEKSRGLLKTTAYQLAAKAKSKSKSKTQSQSQSKSSKSRA